MEQSLTTIFSASIIQVLQTALPSSLFQEALTNSAAVSSQIASEFAAGETPSWYSAIPSDIKTYLNPSNSAAASSIVSDLSSQITGMASIGTASALQPNMTALSGNSTAVRASQSAILSSIHAQNSSVIANATAAGTSSGMMNSASMTGAGSSSTGGAGAGGSSQSSGSSGSSSSSSAGASMPTAIYGMSLAGAVGLVGVLAL